MDNSMKHQFYIVTNHLHENMKLATIVKISNKKENIDISERGWDDRKEVIVLIQGGGIMTKKRDTIAEFFLLK